MGKFTGYLLTLMGILVLFYIFGLDTGGATTGLLDVLLSVEDIQSGATSGDFLGIVSSGGVKTLSFLIVAATSLAIGGVVVAVTRGFNVGDLIPWTVVPVLLNIGYEYIYVFTVIKDFSPIFAFVVIAPLIVLWVLTVIEWARGVTT